ncbi:MAG TPA: type II toxin-antitoxin system RelE/ParE family toxin [Bryobacteraceae bacterium]
MIESFRCAETEKVFNLERSRVFGNIAQVAVRRLVMLNEAEELRDLASVPGNRLEALKDDRKGQHSIQINDQFRVCFRWESGNAHDVEIVDYH